MKKMITLAVATITFGLFAFAPGAMAQQITVAMMNEVLAAAPSQGFWQVKAEEVNAWINQKKTDFMVIDVRPNPNEYTQGHIPGSIHIPVQNILSPENLATVPKGKKVILACVTGQTQNLPVVILRAMGYDVYTMAFGYASWTPGYHGGQNMQKAIQNATTAQFPLVK